MRVVGRGNSDKNSDGSTSPSLGGLAAVFERLPCQLEKQSMLRVDEDSLTGRDAEEIGIELVDTLEESSAARDIQASEGVGVPP